MPFGRTSRYFCSSFVSEFDPASEGNHTRCAVAAEAGAQQSRRRRGRAVDGAESGLRGWHAGDARLIGGQGKVGMIEPVKELRVELKCQVLAQRNALGNVEL